MAERVFGNIPGIQEGHLFDSRHDLAASGVHRPRQAGISGGEKEGADSIVLSGGYEDDKDYGDVIIYTGHGGRDPETAQQVGDQLLLRGNKALAYSCIHGLPVRVIRGSGLQSPFAPKFGYRYDGCYRVETYWRDTGRSGHSIWRFRLVKLPPVGNQSDFIHEASTSYEPASRSETTIQRIVRDSQQARKIKELYDYHCQICNLRLETSAGAYAEAAHIRPLGEPHNGSDTPDNILCLCPNHHVLFDYGAIGIADDLTLLGMQGQLITQGNHQPNVQNLRYHRAHYFRAI
jgi:putative restriction endonuclease